MSGWNHIEEMFDALHKANFKYVILRNYEEIDADNFYTSGHADIDFLTSNGHQFAKVIGASPRFVKDDGIHYKVMIAGTEVVIDARSVGDGYYDAHWEREILSRREWRENRFYIADDLNYYYSLVYHAILQKKALANDYLVRLNAMAAALNIRAVTEREHLKALERFMKEKGYFYTVPYDIHVPFRKELVDQTMVKKQMNVSLRDGIIKLMQTGSRVKRTILRH